MVSCFSLSFCRCRRWSTAEPNVSRSLPNGNGELEQSCIWSRQVSCRRVGVWGSMKSRDQRVKYGCMEPHRPHLKHQRIYSSMETKCCAAGSFVFTNFMKTNVSGSDGNVADRAAGIWTRRSLDALTSPWPDSIKRGCKFVLNVIKILNIKSKKQTNQERFPYNYLHCIFIRMYHN